MNDCKCKENIINNNSGYNVCFNCGSVLSIIISDEPEWRSFDTDKSRCGMGDNDENPYSSCLTTYINPGSKSTIIKNGKCIKSDVSYLHIIQSYNNKEKTFSIIQTTFDNLASTYSSNVILTCKKMWKTIIDSNKIIRSGPRKGLIGNCLYYSCIFNNCPRTINEICKDTKITHKDFNKGSHIFIEIFHDKEEWDSLFNSEESIESYFIRYTNILENIEIIDKNKSYVIAKKCMSNYNIYNEKLSHLTTNSIICGILYYTCIQEEIPITKQIMTKKFNICNPTLNKVLKLIDN